MQHRGGAGCAGSFRPPGVSGGGQLLLQSLAIAGGGDKDGHDGAGAPSPCSLDSAVLAAILVVVVDMGAGNGGDYAICLAELEPGKKAHALPRCGHRFHVECRGGGGGHWGGEGRAVPPIRKDPTATLYGCPTGSDNNDVAEGGEERCDTRSTFEASKYNSCNIRLKVVKTLETCF
jgi:hypothetical protein